MEPDITNGSIVTLRFEVNADAQDGACELELDVNDLVDSEFNDVPSASNGGKITITK